MRKHAALRLVTGTTPTIVNGNVPPRRQTNAARRDREYLTLDEVERMRAAASKAGRHGHRDSTLLLVAFRHGLRASELVSLRWTQIDLRAGTVLVRRLKGSRDSVQPLGGEELRALRRLRRDYPDSPYVFETERKGPLTTSTIRKLVARAGALAGLPFPTHPHMLRHACGHHLANKGTDTRSLQAYLGHANIMHTVRYTELSASRFDGLWGAD